MASASVLRDADRLWLLEPGRPPQPLEVGRAEEFARQVAEEFSAPLAPALLARLGQVPGPLRVGDPTMAHALRRAGLAVAAMASREAATLLRGVPAPAGPAGRRAFFQRLGQIRVRTRLAEPAELVVSLAREEERLERSVGREESAARQFITGGAPATEAYAAEWTQFRSLLAGHHARLVARLEEAATQLLPNLSVLVGPRVAARLLAASGGPGALSRMSAARLQLLGARRRPGPGRGPRFGLIYRAVSASGLAPDRWARYARSLAALAVIAARADLLTHRSVHPELIRRRDRRRADLARGGSR